MAAPDEIREGELGNKAKVLWLLSAKIVIH